MRNLKRFEVNVNSNNTQKACHIPSKPAKYRIKIFALYDPKTFYTSNLEVYCEIQPDSPFQLSNKPNNVVKRLAET